MTRGVGTASCCSSPPALIVAALLGLVPLVYGSSFDQTVGLGFVLLPGVLALGVGKVLASVVAGRGGVRYNLYTAAIVAAVTLALYFTLIPAYDEWGAAVASSISYLASAVISAVFFRRVLGIPLSHALIPTTADLRNYPEALDALRAHLRSRRVRRPSRLSSIRGATGRSASRAPTRSAGSAGWGSASRSTAGCTACAGASSPGPSARRRATCANARVLDVGSRHRLLRRALARARSRATCRAPT